MRWTEAEAPQQSQSGSAVTGRNGDPCFSCSVRHMTICSPLEGEELLKLAGAVSTLHLDAHRSVFDEGEPATHLFNVTQGSVKLYKLMPDGRRQVVGFLFDGDFLGLAGASGEAYAYSAEAITAVEICRMPRRKLEQLLESHPKVERRLLGIAAAELAAAQEQMLLLGRKTAKERLASFLIQLSQRSEHRGGAANPVALPMSRADIADYLGLTTETVSRTITQLKQSRVISLMPGGFVRLNDAAALRQIADGY